MQNSKKPKKLASFQEKVELATPKLVELSCKNCGASLQQIDETHAECPFCKKSYLIDQPEDINISVYVNETEPKVMDHVAPKPTSVVSVWISAAAIFLIVVGAILLGVISDKKNEPKPLETLFYEGVFGRSVKKISKSDLSTIKYLRYYTKSNSSRPVLEYSFLDYAQCESEEEFLSSIQTWECETTKYKTRFNFSALTGLTRVDASNNPKLLQSSLCKEAPISYLATTKDACDVITCISPEKLRVLHLLGQNETLTGIDTFTNLESLLVRCGSYDDTIDITGIGGCTKLRSLVFENNASFLGISEIAKLTELTELKLHGVTLRVIAPMLTKLVKLQSLSVDVTEGDDITVLNALSELTELEFLKDAEFDPMDIKDLQKLTYLKGAINGTKAFDALCVFPNLERLTIMLSFIDFSDRVFVDGSALSSMSRLKELRISTFFGNTICNAECMLNLPELELFELTGRSISKENLFLNSDNLKQRDNLLSFRMNGYIPKEQETKEALTFDILTRYTGLTYVHLSENELEDISFLAGLKDLQECVLEENEIVDYSPLSKLPHLRRVCVYGNPNIDCGLSENVEVITKELR